MEAVVPSLRHDRDRLVQALLEGTLAPAEFPRRYAEAADSSLTTLFRTATGDRRGGYALVAVGGYGRGELCPASDLDVMLVHRRQRNVKQVADRIWYSIWDSGVRLDHSVRTPNEAVAVARDDQRALLGLLDARLVDGDEDLFDTVRREIGRYWETHARRLLPDLASAGVERHGRFGEVPFLLEPDLKESAGGLRDLEALSLAARGVPVIAEAVMPHGLGAHRRFLLATRAALHALTGGSSDRLGLQDQDDVAPLLDREDADALMAAVSEAGREVMWATAEAWRRIESHLRGPSRRSGSRDLPVAPGIAIRDGAVAFTADADASSIRDGTSLLKAVAAAAEYGVEIDPAALERVAEVGLDPPEPWSEELRQAFLSVLEYGPAATHLLEQLDQRRYWEAFLPEWSHVRHRPQRNAYHRFTVDRHLLEASAQAALILRRVRRPDLLLVGALLHDVAKGRPGDHSAVGAGLAVGAAQRMGYEETDAAIVGRLVELHLFLSETATRRDLSDPATIESVAATVGDRETLSLLAALTEADSIATGPTAWTPWKAGLVRELAEVVDAELAARENSDTELAARESSDAGPAGVRGASPLGPPGWPIVPTQQQLTIAAAGRLAVRREGDTVTVVAPDRPGLLSLVAGTLALHRLSILSASAVDVTDGMAIEVFRVSRPESSRRLADEALEQDLERAVDGSLLLSARLKDLESVYARSRRPAAARPAEIVVVVDELASSRATVVEVRAPDSEGLLYRLTSVLAEAGLDVLSARVSTLGHEVVDAFYVVDAATAERPGIDSLKDLEAKLVEAARPLA